MSLKDHLRSLGDKEFLQELANSEPQKASSQKEATKEARTAEPKEAKPAQPAPRIEPKPAVVSTAQPEGLDSLIRAVVTILADNRTGKGFLVDQQGRILTNLHLVKSASRIRVTTHSGDVFLARLLKKDDNHDLALIQIPARNKEQAAFGDAQKLDVGDEIWVLGTASSALGRMVQAVVCGLRTLNGTSLIQVNQLIAPADSGSPFASPNGSVVGISNCEMGDGTAEISSAINVADLKAFLADR